METNHYHYMITLAEKNTDREMARVLEIRQTKPSINYIKEIEKRHKFATVLCITELECDCEK